MIPRLGHSKIRIAGRWLLAVGSSILLVLGHAAPGHADTSGDGAGPPSVPFPDMRVITGYYTQVNFEDFYLPDRPGVWFLSPSGMNCGIWIWGSFGCAGDIPGAPPGDNHIAWFNGNRAVHHGWTAAIQFPPGQAQQTLPALSYVTFEQTTCAVTVENNVYCGHGPFQLYMTAQGTWFKGWNDRNSYVCNSYGTCPPG